MTIAILSWGAERTLVNTLESYAYHRLERLDDERLVLLQDATEEQIRICESFGWTALAYPTNFGIAQGYRRLLESATGEFFLFLENDWELITDPTEQIVTGKQLLNEHLACIVRYRHRTNPGNPLWTRQFEGHEYQRPTHLLDSIHWTDPSQFPEIRRHAVRSPVYRPVTWGIDPLAPLPTINSVDWYITTSRNANWTNNPHMYRTEHMKTFLLEHLGSRDLEVDIQSWWEEQDDFRVAQSEGLFTHNRLD